MVDRLNICICFGPNWKQYVLVQLFALFNTNKGPFKIYLISEGLDSWDLDQFQNLCDEYSAEFVYHDLDEFFRRKIGTRNVSARFTKYTLFRLSIPFLINDDRLLYLDADTLVLGDIRPMYEMDFDNKLAIGHVDTGHTFQQKRQIGFKKDFPYINAGVILFDLKRIREGKFGETWLKLIKSKSYPCHDQDVINLSLQGRVGLFGPEYNCSLSTTLEVPDEDIRIMHFAGIKNPWIKDLPKYHLWEKWESLFDKRPKIERPTKIKKLICYGWFGGNPKPENIQRCIESWGRVCPDYEVLELNESNCDPNETEFTREAYAQKKWAYVSDYFRMKAMYEKGCITLDADVELVKPLDQFLSHRMFSGQEINDRVLITATMGAEAGHPIIRMILEYYKLAKFQAIPNTRFITQLFVPLIEKKIGDKILLYGDCHLYPQVTFCNYDHKRFRVLPSNDAFAYHHFGGTWKTK